VNRGSLIARQSSARLPSPRIERYIESLLDSAAFLPELFQVDEVSTAQINGQPGHYVAVKTEPNEEHFKIG